MIKSRLKLWALQLQLFFKNPRKFFKNREFNKDVDQLELAVKKKIHNHHQLKLEINAFARKKRKQGRLTEHQILKLVESRFKGKFQEAKISSVRFKGDLIVIK